MSDTELRKQLRALLNEPHAHAMFDDVVDGFPVDKSGQRIEGFVNTAWQILEHLRICQWDILEFSRRADHVSPDFPEGYWPDEEAAPSRKAWQESIRQFRNDLQEMLDLIGDTNIDLFTPFPHGDGQNLVREAIVLAKHNSYHLGQLLILKKVALA